MSRSMKREPGQLFYLATQGCKVNQYESQALRESFQADGLMEAVSVFRTGAEVARALPAAIARSAAPQAPVAVAPVQKRAAVKPVPAAKPAVRPRPAAVARAVPELALASDNEWQEF